MVAVRVIPSESINPQFEIDLHVLNPNSRSLALRGLSYTLAVKDRELIKGVANQLPVIEAFGEGDIQLLATADLVSSFRLLGDFLKNPAGELTYHLDIKLDVGEYLPLVYIEKQGELNLLGLKK